MTVPQVPVAMVLRPARISQSFSVSQSVHRMLTLMSEVMDQREAGYIIQDGIEALWHHSKDPRIQSLRDAG